MKWYDDFRRFLPQDQQLHNAQIVANFLIKLGREKNAICGLLGNMSHESSINPNMYEYGYSWGSNRGFGLVQWTPRTKLSNWCSSKGLDFRKGESQLQRIEFEVNNEIQWLKTREYNFSFKEFSKNTPRLDVNKLTHAFQKNYERPANPMASLPKRQEFARLCLKKLDFTGSKDTNIPVPSDDKPPVTDTTKPVDGESMSKFFSEQLENIKDRLSDALSTDLYMYDGANYYSNAFLTIYKTHDNLYKVKPTIDFDELVIDAYNDTVDMIGNLEDKIKKPKKNNDSMFKPIPKPTPPNPVPSISNNKNINKVIAKAMSYKLDSVKYSMYGARDMVSSGDCSSFIQICFRAGGVNVGGFTGAQYTYALNNGKIIVDGGSSKVEEIAVKRRPGDYILMCKPAAGNFGGGGASHVVLVVSDTDIRHQTAYPNWYGPKQTNCNNYIRTLRDRGYTRWCLVRPFN